MTDQALEDLGAIVCRLIPGMSLRLDATVVPHFFDKGATGKDACS
jgi:hypothetical protein